MVNHEPWRFVRDASKALVRVALPLRMPRGQLNDRPRHAVSHHSIRPSALGVTTIRTADEGIRLSDQLGAKTEVGHLPPTSKRDPLEGRTAFDPWLNVILS